MGLFSKKPKDLSIPANRKIDLNPSRKYLEWNDARILWEEEYFQLHKAHGWKLISGYERNPNPWSEPCIWSVNGVGVHATFDSYKGIVTEKIL
jgi:hypothetical protein